MIPTLTPSVWSSKAKGALDRPVSEYKTATPCPSKPVENSLAGCQQTFPLTSLLPYLSPHPQLSLPPVGNWTAQFIPLIDKTKLIIPFG